MLGFLTNDKRAIWGNSILGFLTIVEKYLKKYRFRLTSQKSHYYCRKHFINHTSACRLINQPEGSKIFITNDHTCVSITTQFNIDQMSLNVRSKLSMFSIKNTPKWLTQSFSLRLITQRTAPPVECRAREAKQPKPVIK